MQTDNRNAEIRVSPKRLIAPCPLGIKNLNANEFKIDTVFGILAFFLISYFLVRSIEKEIGYISSSFSIDDTFYYLNIAWNTKLYGFVTFDGIHEANGVHFLWFLLLSGVAQIFSSHTAFFYSAFAITYGLCLSSFILLWRIGSVASNRQSCLSLLLVLGWTLVLSEREHQFLSGMESAIHMAVLLVCLLALITFRRNLDSNLGNPSRAFLVLAGMLVLLTWARLDSAIYSAAIYLTALFYYSFSSKIDSRLKFRTIVISIVIAMSGALIQLGFYYESAGTYLPISGLVKSQYSQPSAVGFIEKYLAIIYPFSLPSNIPSQISPWLGTGTFTTLLIYTITRARQTNSTLKYLYEFSAVLGVGTIFYGLAIAENHSIYWKWYLSPVFLFFIITLSCAVSEITENIRSRENSRQIYSFVFYTTAFCIIIIGVLNLSVTHRPIALYTARYELAKSLRANSDEQEVFAAFNAGQLAYFSQRKFINLDGLVNDRFYYNNILHQDEKITEYLESNGVSYIVDYDFYWARDEIINNSTLRHTYAVNDGERRVLQVREMIDR